MKHKKIKALLALLLVSNPITGLPVAQVAHAAATPLTPPSNVTLQADRTVSWTGVSGNIGYRIKVYNAQNNQLVGTAYAGYNSSTAPLDSLLVKNGTYYVRVVTLGNNSTTTDSAESTSSNMLTINSSITLAPPGTPLLSPDGQIKWTAGLNNGYVLNVYHSPSNTLVTTRLLDKDTTSFDLLPLIPASGEYYVRLIAKGNNDSMLDSAESQRSYAQKFTATRVPAPASSALDRKRVATWANVPGNEGYRISVYNAQNDQILGFAQASKDNTSLDISHLITQSGSYYVKVQTLGLKGYLSDDSSRTSSRSYIIGGNLYAVPDELLNITKDPASDAINVVHIDRDQVLSDLDSRPDLFNLLISAPVQTGGISINIPGAVLDRVLTHSLGAELRVVTGLGTWKVPVSKLQSIAKANTVNLTESVLHVGLEQTESNLPTSLETIPVKFSLHLISTNKVTPVSLAETTPYLSLTMPLDATLNADIKTLAGVRIDQNNNYHPVPTLFERGANGVLTASFKYQGTGTFAVLKNRLLFPDILDTYYAKNSIESLSSKRIINGFEDGSFRPNETVTRAQFAVMLVKALGLKDKTEVTVPAPVPVPPPTPAPTTPVPPTETELDTTFTSDTAPIPVPTETPTVPAPTQPEPPTPLPPLPMPEPVKSSFTDVENDDWFFGAVETAYRAGLISGRGEGVFAPQDLISEQEMATMISRALQYAELNVPLTNTEQQQLIGQLKHSDSLFTYAKIPTAICFKTGILTGPTLDNFTPRNSADRGMAADMLYRMMKLLTFIN